MKLIYGTSLNYFISLDYIFYHKKYIFHHIKSFNHFVHVLKIFFFKFKFNIVKNISFNVDNDNKLKIILTRILSFKSAYFFN